MASDHFVIDISLNTPNMQNQHDVAAALRRVSDYLDKLTSDHFGPYGREGDIRDSTNTVVGTWRVKGPHDDNDE